MSHLTINLQPETTVRVDGSDTYTILPKASYAGDLRENELPVKTTDGIKSISSEELQNIVNAATVVTVDK